VTLPVLVDSSALMVLFDMEDGRREEALRTWRQLVKGSTIGTRDLVTHHAVITESSAVLARRFGFEVQRDLFGKLLPVVRIVWITENLHERARAAFLAESRRRLSFVDCLSFEVMRSEQIRHAFAYDRHFEENGFPPPPESEETP